MRVDDYQYIWVVDTEFKVDPGERPIVHCLVAREVRGGDLVRLTRDQLVLRHEAPFATDSRALIVGYYLPAEFGCFLELGWKRPVNSLDLCTEYKRLKSGIRDGKKRSLVAALMDHGRVDAVPGEKEEWRQLAMRGGPFTQDEMCGLLNYCQQDVDATAILFSAMAPKLDLPRALLRGRYAWAVAQMEHTGIPIDLRLLSKLRQRWAEIITQIIAQIDQDGVYEDGHFSEARFGQWLSRRQLPWPKLESGRLALDRDTFRQQAKAYSVVAPYYELRTTLAELRLNELAVGTDGRNRTMLSPFGSSTGRNQPSNTRFVFGPATWIRGLIKPSEGQALAYVDWSQQELGAAAALSGDEKMKAAYTSGDPYLSFARMAGAVPPDATKLTHPEERALYKKCMLAVQYGMGARSLAQETGGLLFQGGDLLQKHKDTFPVYWQWSNRVQDVGFGTGRLWTRFGWQRNVRLNDPPASVRNFPVQGNGAEILRLAIMRALDDGIRVIAPVHDAILIEAPLENLDEHVSRLQRHMEWAGAQVLDGFQLASDVKIVRFPDRFMDENRALRMWNTIMTLIGEPPYRYD